MKKIITFLFLVLVLGFQLQAQTIYYVDASHASASDDNDGTSVSTPWKTLNPTKWTSGSEIHIAPGTYTLSAATITKDIVKLIGLGTTSGDVIIQSMEDAAYNSATSGGFIMFDVRLTGEFTCQNLTIKNVTSAVNGGAFQVRNDGKLTLDNVVLDRMKVFGTRYGAAIYAIDKATVNISNSVISNCSSNTGGAIYMAVNSNVEIQNTLFYKNRATANGGVIAMRQGADAVSALTVKNSTFQENESDNFCAVLDVAKTGTPNANTKVDVSLINNTFYKNKGSMVTDRNTNTIQYSLDAVVKGNLLMVNNTFYKNNNTSHGGNSRSVFIADGNITSTLINNIFLDAFAENHVSLLSSATTLNRTQVMAYGNVCDIISVAELDVLFTTPSAKNLLGESNATVHLQETLLVPTSGVPYLPILQSDPMSVAIDTGLNTYTDAIHPVNVVPANDVTGRAIEGTFKDVGAFEFPQSGTGINNITNKGSEIIIVPNPCRDYITVDVEDAIKIELFDLSGKMLLAKPLSGELINVSMLQSGIYLVKVYTPNRTMVQKLIKN